jgi:hypothetical protein
MIFPSPAGMSLTKLSLAMESLVSDILVRDGKIDNIFLQCMKKKFYSGSMVLTTIIQAKIHEDIIQALGFMFERRRLTIEKRDDVSKDEETLQHGVTKRCRLSWQTNSALVYEPKYGGDAVGCGDSAKEYSCAHGAQK